MLLSYAIFDKQYFIPNSIVTISKIILRQWNLITVHIELLP